MKILFSILLFLAISPAGLAAEPVAFPSTAPLFAATLDDLDDKAIALERYRGKPLIVNFWARWCGPCRDEIPELIKYRAQHKGKLEVLGIGIENKADSTKEFAKAYDMDYPVFVAKEKGIPLMQALGNTISGLPYTLFINRKGEVIKIKTGTVKKHELEAITPILLAK